MIEIEDTPTKTGLRGRLERLYREYAMKAHALKVTTQILDDDDRRVAVNGAPKKFLQAMNHRNGATGRAPVTTHGGRRPNRRPKAERLAQITAFLTEHPKATTTEISKAIGVKGNRVTTLIRAIAKSAGRESGKHPHTWVLKG